MLHAPNRFIRPEPFRPPQTLIDAARYYELAELIRVLEGEIEAEARPRRPGQRGGRREQILTRTLQHLRRAAHSMKPLAGLESWSQATE